MNEELNKEFCHYLLSIRLSDNRIRKYKTSLNTISKLLNKDFKRTNKDDIVNLLAKLQKMDYAENTKRDFRAVIRIFWKWLKKSDDFPDEVNWIKTSIPSRLQKRIKTKDVLTEDEIYKMVAVAQHTRDKAIISMLYETGSRIGEIMNLKITDIVFDDKGYNFVSCLGKTGEIYKRVVNIKAVELLKNWINEHPLKNNSDSPLWVTLARSHTGIKQMGYAGFRNMLLEVGNVAGITKKVNPHSFRHAKITDLRLNKKVPDAIIEMMVGWIPGTNMFDTYQHGKSEDVDKALVDAYGLKPKQQENKLIQDMEKLLTTDKEFRNKIAKVLVGKGLKYE